MKSKIQQKPSHIKDLILLFAIPIGIALFTATVVYMPRVFAKPGYDFVYVECGYRCLDAYSIQGGRVIDNRAAGITNNYSDRFDQSTLRYYDSKADLTRPLPLIQAQQLMLDSSSRAPDGYELSREYGDDGILFFRETKAGWYLKNGSSSKEINLSRGDMVSAPQIKFLGWVIQ